MTDTQDNNLDENTQEQEQPQEEQPDKTQEELRNLKIALKQEREKLKTLKSQQEQNHEEYNQLKQEKQQRLESEQREKGEFDALLKTRDEQINSLTQKIEELQEYKTFYDGYQETKQQEIMQKLEGIPSEKRDLVMLSIEGKDLESQSKIIDGFMDITKKEDFGKTPPKNKEIKANESNLDKKYTEARKEGFKALMEFYKQNPGYKRK